MATGRGGKAAEKGQVTLRGRFRPGTRVRLVKVSGPAALRAEGGELIEQKRVDADGTVQFTDGVEDGGRYFVVGYVDGFPVEVRIRGNTAGYEDSVSVQAPIQQDLVRHRDGTIVGDRGQPKVPVVRQAEHDDAKKAAIKESKDSAASKSATSKEAK